MKQLFIMLVFVCTASIVFAQEKTAKEVDIPVEPRASVTLGVLQGGGSLLGADLEFMLNDRFSFQVGAGFIGFGAGLNYHLTPSIQSSMISLAYWHQGVGELHTQTLLGPSYVFRAKKLFTAQIGLGYALEEGPAWPESKEQPPVMLLYSIGIYLPVR